MFPASVNGDDYCYLTATGRKSGEPRTIEIWFAIADGVLYMLAGGGRSSHWVRNIACDSRVSVRIREQTLAGSGRFVSDSAEDALARRLLFDKYTPRYSGDLVNWSRSALPMAVDFPASADSGTG